MKYLIVGASGFVGRNILAHARARGVVAVGTQAHAREPGLVTFDLLRHRIADCVDASFFQGPEPVCIVITAVISDMDLCLTNRAMAHQVNVEKTIQLIDDALALRAKIVFLSSCFVFDGQVGYYNEQSPLSPANEYGRHKVEVEEYLRAHAPDALVARLDKIVGDNPGERHLLAFWHQRVMENQPIVCLEGSLLSPTWVRDVAQGLMLAGEKGLSGLFHLANSEFFYRDELARHFCRALGKPPNVITKPLAEFHFADNRALKSYLDGTQFAVKTGLKFTSMREVFEQFARQLDATR